MSRKIGAIAVSLIMAVTMAGTSGTMAFAEDNHDRQEGSAPAEYQQDAGPGAAETDAEAGEGTEATDVYIDEGQEPSENAGDSDEETVAEDTDRIDQQEMEQPAESEPAEESESTAAANSLTGEKKLMSSRDVVIVLDPGHGGSENGAYYGGIKEKVINFKIARACKAELEKYEGVKVYLTRTGDTTLSLPQRAAKAAKYDPDMLISIHNNAVDEEGTGGCEAWYPNKYGPDSYGVKGKALGKSILNELHYEGLHNRGTKCKTGNGGHDYYGIIRNSKSKGFPAIIVEHAFLDIPAERTKYLSTDASLKRLGIADATGIAAYYGLKRFSFNEDGAVEDRGGKLMASCWVRVNGKYYHTDEEGVPQTGFRKIRTCKYYLNADGARSGWLTKGTVRYYRANDRGRLLCDTVSKLGNYRYGFNADGVMYKGVTKVIKGRKYVFTKSGKSVVYKAKAKKKIKTYKGPGTGYKKMSKIKKNASLVVVRTSGKWSMLEDGRWFKTKYRKSVSKYPKKVE